MKSRIVSITSLHLGALIVSLLMVYFLVLPETGNWTSIFISCIIIERRLQALNQALENEKSRLESFYEKQQEDIMLRLLKKDKPRNEDC